MAMQMQAMNCGSLSNVAGLMQAQMMPHDPVQGNTCFFVVVPVQNTKSMQMVPNMQNAQNVQMMLPQQGGQMADLVPVMQSSQNGQVMLPQLPQQCGQMADWQDKADGSPTPQQILDFSRAMHQQASAYMQQQSWATGPTSMVSSPCVKIEQKEMQLVLPLTRQQERQQNSQAEHKLRPPAQKQLASKEQAQNLWDKAQRGSQLSKVEQDHLWHIENGFPYYMPSTTPATPLPTKAGTPTAKQRGASPRQPKKKKTAQEKRAAQSKVSSDSSGSRTTTLTTLSDLCSQPSTMTSLPDYEAVANPTKHAFCGEDQVNREGICSDMTKPKEKGGSSKFTMKEQLSLLRLEDPAKVLVARRINKLGFTSAESLRAHFASYGQVKDVHVSHSRVKSFVSTGHRRYGISEHQRLRAAGLGFVIMDSAEVAQKILAEGQEHRVNGVNVQLMQFELTEQCEHAGEEAEEKKSNKTESTQAEEDTSNQIEDVSNDYYVAVESPMLTYGSRERYPSPGSDEW